jgi:hypothetical protein
MDLAEELAQPWTLAMALGYAALVHVLRGDRQAALERAEATIQLATEQGGFLLDRARDNATRLGAS